MRRRRRLAWIAFFGWGPATLLLSAWLERKFGLGNAQILVAALTTPVLFWLSIRQGLWPCPRCGKPFFQPFDSSCLHCCLPKYVPDDPDQPARNALPPATTHSPGF